MLFRSWPLADTFALALVIGPPGAGRTLSLQLTGEANVTPCTDAGLDEVRTNIPAARAVPLLQALAGGRAASVMLEGLPGMALRVDVFEQG